MLSTVRDHIYSFLQVNYQFSWEPKSSSLKMSLFHTWFCTCYFFHLNTHPSTETDPLQLLQSWLSVQQELSLCITILDKNLYAPGVLYTTLWGTSHHYTVLILHYNYLHTCLSHTLNTLAAGSIYYSYLYGMEKAQESATYLIIAMIPTDLTHCIILFNLLKTMLPEATTNLQLSPLTPSPTSFQLENSAQSSTYRFSKNTSQMVE